MGLHNRLIREWFWTYRWYAAWNQREGRKHLFQVPIVRRRFVQIGQYDRDYYSSRQLEERLDQEREPERFQWPGYFKENVEGQPFTRMCSRAQAVEDWESPYSWYRIHDYLDRPRGYCETCWTRMTEIPRSVIMPVPREQQNNNAPRFMPGMDMKQWLHEAAGGGREGDEGIYAL